MYVGHDQSFLTVEVSHRLHSLFGQCAAVTVAPRPGEGLADLIFRASAANGHKTLSEFFGKKGSFSHSAFAVKPPHLPNLADFLGLPLGEVDLRSLLYERKSEWGTWIRFFGADLPTRQFTGGRRVSPRALRDSLHSKAIWHLNALGFDPRNYELLLGECPVCNTRLDFQHSAGVHRCHRCGPRLDLREYPQALIEVSDIHALDFVTGLIDPERHEGKLAVSQLHTDLKNENPGHIFTLSGLIGAALEKKRRKSGRRLISATALEPDTLARAGRAILNWPEGVAEIVEEIGQMRSTSKQEQHSFAVFCRHSGVLNKSLLNSVHQVLARSRFGANQNVRCLRRLHVVPGDIAPEKADALARFAAVAINGSMMKACRRLSLPPIVLYNCYLRGLCGVATLNPDEVGSQIWTWAQALDFREVATAQKIREVVTVRRCVSALYRGCGDVWPSVIEAILDSRLPVSIDATKVGFDALNINDVSAWTTFLAEQQGVTDCHDFPLTSVEVAFYLSISVGAAQLMFDFKTSVTHDYLQRLFRNVVLSGDLMAMRSLAGRPLTRVAITRILDKASLRAKGDLYVPRADAMRALQLV